MGEAPPPYDLACPLMSLPHAFRTELSTIPAPVPYLHAEPALAAAWRELDEQVLAPLLPALDQGLQLTLTLCGERRARTWAAAPRGWGARLSAWLRPPQLATALETL